MFPVWGEWLAGLSLSAAIGRAPSPRQGRADVDPDRERLALRGSDRGSGYIGDALLHYRTDVPAPTIRIYLFGAAPHSMLDSIQT